MAHSFSDTSMVFGHRGVRWEAPENTVAGFARARAMGLAGVEFDVQLCGSGEPVVIHDYTVNKTTDGTGRVADMSLADLRTLDAGVKFSPAFAGERVPTLDETIEALGPDLLLNIEIKIDTVKTDGLEAVVCERVRAHGCAERVLFSSFNPFALFRVRRLMPAVPIGLLYTPDNALYLRRTWFAPLLRPDAMHPEFTMLDAAGLARARAYGTIVNTWTVNDVTEMQRMLDLGINAIITDEPAVLQAIAAGAAPPPPAEMTHKAARKAANP